MSNSRRPAASNTGAPSSSTTSSKPLAPALPASATARSQRAGSARSRQRTKLFAIFLLIAASGCYYEHLARGQAGLWWAREPLARALENPMLSDPQRNALSLVPEVRQFAAGLGLTVEDQYTHYVPWPSDRILTNLVATPPGNLEPYSFHYPLVGALPYRGFFDQGRAEAAADSLRERGFDVCLSAVPAYSTLGWLADPVTEPMLQWGPATLVEMLIHELVHATVFVKDDATLSEGLATFVGQEGAVRFFGASEGPTQAARERARVRDDRRIAGATADFRAEVASLYEEPAGPARSERRAALTERARETIAALPLETRDAEQVAANARLNDACLALAATYESNLAAYANLLELLDGDLRAFVGRARAASKADHPRTALLGQSAP